jgi:hypothetical protein
VGAKIAAPRAFFMTLTSDGATPLNFPLMNRPAESALHQLAFTILIHRAAFVSSTTCLTNCALTFNIPLFSPMSRSGSNAHPTLCCGCDCDVRIQLRSRSALNRSLSSSAAAPLRRALRTMLRIASLCVRCGASLAKCSWASTLYLCASSTPASVRIAVGASCV